MNNQPFKNNQVPLISPVTAAFLGLIGVFILYQFVGSILTLAIFGLDIEHANVNLMRLMTIAGQILFILLPSLLLAKFVYEDVTHIIRFRIPSFRETGVFALGLIILTPLLQSYIFLQNQIIEVLAKNSVFINSIKSGLDKLDKLMESAFMNLLSAGSIWEGAFVIIVIAITPAICEEVFFRGFVQKSFELKWSPFKSILVTSIFFGFYHFNPYALPALIALGFYFGYAVYKSESIIVAFTLHFLNNFISAIGYFIYGTEDIISAETTDPISSNIVSFAVMLIIFVVFIYFVRENYDRLTNKPAESSL